jgi:anthranilate/para-aminobenzoate synthase component II
MWNERTTDASVAWNIDKYKKKKHHIIVIEYHPESLIMKRV